MDVITNRGLSWLPAAIGTVRGLFRPRPCPSGRPKRAGPLRSGGLQVEPLEPRRLLTVLGLEMSLYEVGADGHPAAEISNDTVEAGQDFFVEILAQDLRASPEGVGGLALDLAWDPAVLSQIDTSFDPADLGSPLVTPDLPLYRSGTLDNEAGTIDELQGARLRSLGVGRSIGADRPERFALLKFEAITPLATSPLSMSLGRGGLGMSYRGRLRQGDILIEPQTISVGAPREPAAAEATPTLEFEFEPEIWEPELVEPEIWEPELVVSTTRIDSEPFVDPACLDASPPELDALGASDREALGVSEPTAAFEAGASVRHEVTPLVSRITEADPLSLDFVAIGPIPVAAPDVPAATIDPPNLLPFDHEEDIARIAVQDTPEARFEDTWLNGLPAGELEALIEAIALAWIEADEDRVDARQPPPPVVFEAFDIDS